MTTTDPEGYSNTSVDVDYWHKQLLRVKNETDFKRLGNDEVLFAFEMAVLACTEAGHESEKRFIMALEYLDAVNSMFNEISENVVLKYFSKRLEKQVKMVCTCSVSEANKISFYKLVLFLLSKLLELVVRNNVELKSLEPTSLFLFKTLSTAASELYLALSYSKYCRKYRKYADAIFQGMIYAPNVSIWPSLTTAWLTLDSTFSINHFAIVGQCLNVSSRQNCICIDKQTAVSCLTSVLSCKVELPVNILTNFATIVNLLDVEINDVLADASRLLLRSPEVTSRALAILFTHGQINSANSRALTDWFSGKTKDVIFGGFKSSNSKTQEGSVSLFKALLSIALAFDESEALKVADSLSSLFASSRTGMSVASKEAFFNSWKLDTTPSKAFASFMWDKTVSWIEKESAEQLAHILFEVGAFYASICPQYVVEGNSIARLFNYSESKPLFQLSLCLLFFEKTSLLPNELSRVFVQHVCASESNLELAKSVVLPLLDIRSKQSLSAKQDGTNGAAYAAETLLLYWHHEELSYAKSSRHRFFSQLYDLPVFSSASLHFDERVYHKLHGAESIGGAVFLLHLLYNTEKYNFSCASTFLYDLITFLILSKPSTELPLVLRISLRTLFASFGNNFQQLTSTNALLSAATYSAIMKTPDIAGSALRFCQDMLRYLSYESVKEKNNSSWVFPSALDWIYLISAFAHNSSKNVLEKCLRTLQMPYLELFANEDELLLLVKQFCFSKYGSIQPGFAGISREFGFSDIGQRGKVKLLCDLISHPEATEHVCEGIYATLYDILASISASIDALSDENLAIWGHNPSECFHVPAVAKASTKKVSSAEAKMIKAAIDEQLAQEAVVRATVEEIRVKNSWSLELLLLFIRQHKLVNEEQLSNASNFFVSIWVPFYNKLLPKELAAPAFLLDEAKIAWAIDSFIGFAVALTRAPPMKIRASIVAPLALLVLSLGRANSIYETVYASEFEPLFFKKNPCQLFQSVLVKEHCVRYPSIATLLVPIIGRLTDKNLPLYKLCPAPRLIQDCIVLSAGAISQVAQSFSRGIPRAVIADYLLNVMESLPAARGDAQTSLIGLATNIGDEQASRLDELSSFKLTDFQAQEESLLVGMLLAKTASDSIEVRKAAFASLEPIDCPSEFDVELHNCCLAGFFESETSVQLQAAKCVELFGGVSCLLELCTAEKSYDFFLKRIENKSPAVAQAAGKAFAQVVSNPEDWHPILEKWMIRYQQLAKPLEDVVDERGILVVAAKDQVDSWELRLGFGLGLAEILAAVQSSETAFLFRQIFIGGVQAFGDRDERVRSAMVDAAMAYIDKQAPLHLEDIDAELQKSFTELKELVVCSEDAEVTRDYIKESTVVCIGNLGAHLSAGDDKRISRIIRLLLDTLATPSESVQYAVAVCLSALLKKSHPQALPPLMENLLKQLFGSSYAERRGAAYGLGGLSKGRGTFAIYKELHLLKTLKDAASDGTQPERREGALMAFEIQSMFLKRKFEPYVIYLVPILLSNFSNPNAQVRQATEDTARTLMQGLSSHCVKQILPVVLNGLFEKAWRSQVGSIEMLGAMAYLAPKELSVNLPLIIPQLCRCLRDPHERVQKAASSALQHFGRVIHSPEIQPLVPVFMKALEDPNARTGDALKALLDTSFFHFIDGPSLALLMPIIQRGLKERGSELKQRAAQITGNLTILSEERDLQPYLNSLVSELLLVLVDPVPETRAIAAKALGLCIGKMPLETQRTLVSSLFESLKAQSGHSVDRWGVAQGLSEVLFRLGVSQLDQTLPEVLENTVSSVDVIREGYLVLLSFLPVTFGLQFMPYLGQTLPCILRGLADDSEIVRSASMKAGKTVIRKYSNHSLEKLLLPELEKGMSHERWRIRQTSLQLLGYLFYNITGEESRDSAEKETDENSASGEDNSDSEQVVQSPTEHTKALHDRSLDILISKLGKATVYRVLSECYLAKCDSNNLVRQAANDVWRIVVTNTNRMLKAMIDELLYLIIPRLALDESADKRTVAEAALQEIVRKLGDAVASQILPILTEELDCDSSTSAVKCGVCLALRHILAYGGKSTLEAVYEPAVNLTKRALFDTDSRVAIAAARAFDSLQQQYEDSHVVDEIVRFLLGELQKHFESQGAQFGQALGALKALMTVRPAAIIPVLLPTLIAQVPLSHFNLSILSVVCAFSKSSIERRLPSVLQALVDTGCLVGATDDLKDTIEVLVCNLGDAVPTFTEFVGDLMQRHLQRTRFGSDDEHDRSNKELCMACLFAAEFFSDGERSMAISSVELADFASKLISCMNRPKLDTTFAQLGITRLVGGLDKGSYVALVPSFRIAICGLDASHSFVPGFSLPKALNPLLSVLLHGLVYADDSDLRLESLQAIAKLMDRTGDAALAGYVIQIAGPMIRVLGDRNPVPIKVLLLQSLAKLLKKTPKQLLPFLPQLQRTFITCMKAGDSSGADALLQIPSTAAAALDELIKIQPRLEWILNELCTLLLSEPANSLYLEHLQVALAHLNSQSKPVPDSILSLLLELKQVEELKDRIK